MGQNQSKRPPGANQLAKFVAAASATGQREDRKATAGIGTIGGFNAGKAVSDALSPERRKGIVRRAAARGDK
jgi:hypothetical protein